MHTIPSRLSRILLVSLSPLLLVSSPAHADIFQWDYINPADPSQGKQQSTTLCPGGAGVNAVPGANLYNRNLMMAYLIGADLTNAYGYNANLTNADLSQANLTGTYFYGATLTGANFSQANLTSAQLSATLTDADFTGAQVRGANFGANSYYGGTGITLAQLYSTASYHAHDLSGIGLGGNNLAGGMFAGQNLTNANFGGATLTDADFTGAEVRGARLYGITPAQLYSTASYAARDLSGITLGGDWSGANFSGFNLTGATLGGNLTGADFTDAEVRGASMYGITLAQLYSTASYAAHDLSGISLQGNNLAGANFAGQNVTNADFVGANVTGASFRDANLRNADFASYICDGSFNGDCYWSYTTVTDVDFTNAALRGASLYGITLAQLYSTASYQAHDLSGISLWGNNLAGANFVGQNLTNVSFTSYICSGWQCNGTPAALTDADFTAADARGSDLFTLVPYRPSGEWGGTYYRLVGEGAIAPNLIHSNGHINGLDLEAGGLLAVRDYDGDPNHFDYGFFEDWGVPTYAIPPIPITVDHHFVMGPGGTLRMVFEADAWDSTISFTPGIPVTLGGTLELTFADNVNLASQLGRTFELFNWTGVNPTGAFAVSSPYRWNLSNLYTTGQVTLTAIPEPATFALISLGLIGLVVRIRRPPLSICSNCYKEESHAEAQRRGVVGIGRSSLRPLRLRMSLVSLVVYASAAHADIFQWEYENYPYSGKRQSTTLCVDGAGVDAVPGAELGGLDLTMAYLIFANLTDANLRFANLNDAYFDQAILTGADFTGAEIRGAYFDRQYDRGGITLAQLYSTASYQAHDLSGISLSRHNLAGANFAGQNLTNAGFSSATLTGADFTAADVQGANLRDATLTDADFTGAEVRGASFSGNHDYNTNRYVGGITLAQLYATASYQAHDLSGINLYQNNLAGANFAGQNLTNANFIGATLTGADFTDAEVRGASFYGITLAQLYSTASYQAHDLSGISLLVNNLAGANLAGQNLTNADFYAATLTGADFTGADVRGASFVNVDSYGITPAQLYSTASYQAHDLSGVRLDGNYLAGANFNGQNLSNATFNGADLTNADLTGADIRGASFNAIDVGEPWWDPLIGGLTLAQLYSTASYQTFDLAGINLGGNYLAGGNFAHQNLMNSSFGTIYDQNPYFLFATLIGADFTGADARGAAHLNLSSATTTNMIWPDGHVNGIGLDADGLLVVRNYDGDPQPYSGLPPHGPIPITINQHMSMGPGGTLRMVFEADAWDSTISFSPGIPVTLGGTLELTFADNVNPASQVGRTFHLFDCTGVTPTGAFAITSPYAWDLSHLYTTGEVTLTAIPQPSSLILLAVVASATITSRRFALPRVERNIIS